MDITQLILDDHNEQRRLFAILEQIGPADIPALSRGRGGCAPPVGSAEWFAAVAAANLANSDHMAEEEREPLADFRRLAGLEQRHNLAIAFTTFQARNYTGVTATDRDPEIYIRQAEGRLPQVPGSLNIGGLKQE